MSINIETVFGSEISITPFPPVCETQFSGVAGANGLTGMRLGFRGYPIIIRGKLRTSYYATYALARAAMITGLNNINAYCDDAEDTWYYGSENHTNTVLERVTLIPDAYGRVYHYTSAGTMYVDFVAFLRSMG